MLTFEATAKRRQLLGQLRSTIPNASALLRMSQSTTPSGDNLLMTPLFVRLHMGMGLSMLRS